MRLLVRRELLKRFEQPVHLAHRVIVHKSDAEHATLGIDPQAFGKIQGIKVAVPREQAAITPESERRPSSAR